MKFQWYRTFTSVHQWYIIEFSMQISISVGRVGRVKCVCVCSIYFGRDMRMLSIPMHSACICSTYKYTVHAYARHTHARCILMLNHFKNFPDFLCQYKRTLNICIHHVRVCRAYACTVHAYAQHTLTRCTRLLDIRMHCACVGSNILRIFQIFCVNKRIRIQNRRIFKLHWKMWRVCVHCVCVYQA